MSAIWIKLHRAPDRPVMINVGAALSMEATESGGTRIVLPETGEDADGVVVVVESLDQVSEKIAKGNSAWHWEYSFDPRSLSLFGFPTTPGTRVLYSWAEEACKALGQPIHEVVARGGSDGSFAAGLGVPTLDGLGAVAHDTCSRRETVEVSSIIPRSAVIAHLIASAAAGRKLA